MSTERQTKFGLSRSLEMLNAIPGGSKVIGTVVIMSAAVNVLLLSGSIFMLMVYDEVLPAHSVPSLVGLVVMLVIAFAFQTAFEHLRQRIAQASAEIFNQNLTNRVFALVIQTELTRGGRDAAQPVRDLDLLRTFFASQGPIAILDLPWMLLFLAVLFVFHWLLGVACLIGALLLVGLTMLTDRLTAAQVEAATVNSSQRSTFIEACRRNAEVIGALGMRGQIQDRWRKMSDQHAEINDEAGDKLSAMRTFSKSFRLLLQSLILAAGAWLVISGSATGGVIIASSILSSRALAPIDSAIGNWRGLIVARQAWNRLAERLLQMPVASNKTALPRPSNNLAVDGLSAVAPGTQILLFRDISFQLKAGDTLAIVGASGSGKSSLSRALVGLLEPIRGAVRLDGASIDQWEPDLAGAFIGYLPQDIELFDGTIAQNIARFDVIATSQEIVAAARQAGVHDLIVHLPNGYDTVIGPLICPLLSGPISILELATKEEWNGEEAQAGRDHRQAA